MGKFRWFVKEVVVSETKSNSEVHTKLFTISLPYTCAHTFKRDMTLLLI